ncbi:hypothetical protein CPB85DRAFT_1373750 [Mucidula mucida]|nr:hypothetical protein CPB85DRAFT_1373750 [Mucidula mucida]
MPHSTATFPRSGVLVLGEHAVHSLVPSTLISQAESLLESHRIQDAIDLADQQRKKIYSNLTVNQDEIEELQYVYQRIGFQCFSETLFEDAGNSFFEGNLDPRLLISYYPDLRGSLFTADDTLNVYAGVASRMPQDVSVDDLIVANLVRNYSPHLSPNTRSAPPTAELRKILGMAAQEMLEKFLKKCRTRRKLYAQLEKTKELYDLLHDDNHVPIFKGTGQYNALCMIYKQTKDDDKLLETWAKLVEGEWSDEDINDPLTDMITLLTEKKDRTLLQHWAIWLTKIDQTVASKKDRGRKCLLKQISEASPQAGIQYLDTYQHLRFFHTFSSTTPDSDHKRVRIKTALFLQGSSLYNVQRIKERLLPHTKLLKLEMSILEGKVETSFQSPRRSLILIHDMHDSTSAEVYCTLGGDVIPGNRDWSRGSLRRSSTSHAKVDDGLKKSLLKILLEVYLAEQSSANPVNLDIADVVPVLPEEWPVANTGVFPGAIVRAVSAAQNLEVKEKTWLILREEGMMIEDVDTEDEDEEEVPVDEKGALSARAPLRKFQDPIPCVSRSPPLHDHQYPRWGRTLLEERLGPGSVL